MTAETPRTTDPGLSISTMPRPTCGSWSLGPAKAIPSWSQKPASRWSRLLRLAKKPNRGALCLPGCMTFRRTSTRRSRASASGAKQPHGEVL